MTGAADAVAAIGSRVTNNLSSTFNGLTAQQWIRLVVIAGAYMLLRPYLIKLGGRVQMRQHEADEKDDAVAAAAAGAATAAAKPVLSANDLRGPVRTKAALKDKVGIPDSDDSEDDESAGGATAASGADWGKNARKRQRHMLRKLLEAHEQKLADAQADEEDKDIQEFLED